ncbi:MAG: hypothetical protein Q8Q97_00010, partial [bacterium]|nr:hypothetical protein [bacterium]
LEQTGGGPGGCQSEQGCEEYCSDVGNIKECVSFAKEHGMMEKGELEEAEKVQQAVERGARLPGGCRNKKACEAHCSNPDNMEECLAFAEQAGFMKKEELEEAKRILPLMKSGQTPGGCRSKQQCEAFCENPDNVEACVSFAEKAGFMKPEEAVMMRKTGGKGPGGCRGRVECEIYCNNPDNAEQCFKFAEENGLIPPEELEQIKKAGGAEFLKQGGPGGCRGKRECEDFCKNPGNQEACFKFAVEKGLIPPEEAEKIRESGGTAAFKGPGGCVGPKECQEYCSAEENSEECQKFRGASEGPGQGGPMMRPGMGPEGDSEGGAEHFGAPGQLQFSGPGGCSDPKGCFEFCRKPENLEACQQFVPGGRGKDDREGRDFNEEDGEGDNDNDFDQEGDGERPVRDEFPGQRRGEFEPPPGFEGARPGQEEFKVPPGFVPPGMEEKFDADREREGIERQGD